MEYRVLGPLEALADDRTVDLGAPRQRALLAFLLLHANEVVSTDRLIEELWRDGAPRTVAKALQVYVSGLRKALADSRDALETRGPGYVLRVRPGELDLHEFERLVASARGEGPADRAETLGRALALWRGAPLADFAYEPFVQAEAARLEELRQLAVEDCFDAELELGRGPELVAELHALVAAQPLRERPRALLMRALYRAGRQSDALDVFREGRELLDEGLGLEPGPELRELERSILQQAPELAAPAASAAPPARAVVAASADGDADALLVLAERLAAHPEPRELVVARIVSPTGLAAATSELQSVRGDLLDRGVRVRVAAFSSSDPGDDLARLAAQQNADLLLVSANGDPLAGALAGVFDRASCDVAAIVEAGGPVVDGPVVVPFGAFEHDWAALELATWVAAALDRPLRLIGAADANRDGKDASRLLADASLIVQHLMGVVAEPLLGPPGAGGVQELAAGAGLLVVGLSDRWRSEGLGPTRSALVHAPPAPTVLVRRGLRPGGLAPRETLTRFTWSIAQPAAGS